MSDEVLNRSRVVVYDGILRMQVPSRRRNVAPYLVELDAYEGNGTCQCKHFACRLEPLLERDFTPEMAVESGQAEVPFWGTLEDSLRCFHIHVARLSFADDVISAIVEARTNETKNDPAQDPPQIPIN